MNGTEEMVLVRQAKHGCRDSLNELVVRNQDYVLGMLRKVMSTPGRLEPEDVAQMAWLKVTQHIRQFRGDARFATWVVRIAWREYLLQLRRRREKVEYVPVEEWAMAEQALSPEDAIRRVEQKTLALSLVEELPEKYRRAITERMLEEKTIKETMKELRLNSTTVKTRTHRGLQLMRKMLEVGTCQTIQ